MDSSVQESQQAIREEVRKLCQAFRVRLIPIRRFTTNAAVFTHRRLNSW